MQLEQSSTEQRLTEAEKIIKEPSFRDNKGCGNEVNYYVFDYPAEDELIVREWVNYWRKKNNVNRDGFNLVVFDLYDIMIDMLEAEGFLEECFKFEKRSGMDRIVSAVGRMLKLSEDSGGILMNYIKDNTPDNSVVFITGIGKCYPVIRSHKVLNNLHQIFDTAPVVLFYPGKYDGQELVLFQTIKDDNYYRAFKLV